MHFSWNVHIADKEKSARRLAIEDTIIAKGKLTFDDIAGLKEAKQVLKEAIIMPLQFPQLFTGEKKYVLTGY